LAPRPRRRSSPAAVSPLVMGKCSSQVISPERASVRRFKGTIRP
jgi:hypothetical protein